MEQSERRVKNERLIGLVTACTTCGASMQSTGRMMYSPVINDWLIEYWCPNEEELYNIFRPETASLARNIAKDME